MSWGVVEPGYLALGILALWPWLRWDTVGVAHPALDLLPADRLSQWMDRGERMLVSLTLLALAVALAAPYRGERWVERVGQGARIVLLVDHSSSMNENFSGAYLGGHASESKAAIASRLLAEFVRRRRDDLFGVVAFSAAPMAVLPLTQDREAILAAIRALGGRGHGVTHIAPGLDQALEYFRTQPKTGARVILLVSDGAARMDPETRDYIRQRLLDQSVSLYWIYLRGARSSHLDAPPANPNESTSPEYFLHQYFQSVGIPYHAYEALDRGGIERALADLERLENQPLPYLERLPRVDVSDRWYALACLGAFGLLLFKMTEVRTWRA